jgi:undecaprenyl-diphosphatase
VAVPAAVALSRLYRGMHHPSDVVGSFVNGILCLLVLARGVLDRSVAWGRARTRRATSAIRGGFVVPGGPSYGR